MCEMWQARIRWGIKVMMFRRICSNRSTHWEISLAMREAHYEALERERERYKKRRSVVKQQAVEKKAKEEN